jgi:hypothetical protein
MCNALALPTLSYVCGTLLIREQDKPRYRPRKWNLWNEQQNARGEITKPMKIFYQNLKLAHS